MGTQQSNAIQPILVIGGQGKTGRRVADRLAQMGLPVRIGSRSSAIPFDWTRPETWRGALNGAQAVYVTYFPDLALPGAAAVVEALAILAREMGVERLALLSGRGEEGAQEAERRFLAAAPQATIVRASWFNQNFSESYLLDGVIAGEIALPAGEVREPFVDADDIADVVVAALTEDGHAGEIYEVTGPEAITFADATRIIAEATGRAISYRQLPLDEFLTGMASAGVPADVADLLRFLFSEVLDGRNTPTTNGVRRALKREPRSFRDYAARAAESGAWKPQ